MAFHAANETPAGLVTSITGIDGNGHFVLANPPSDPSLVAIFSAGLRLASGIHYALAGRALDVVSGFFPLVGDAFLSDYPYPTPLPPTAPFADVGNFAANEVPLGVIDSTDGFNGNGLFVLANIPQDPTLVEVYRAGLRLTLNVHYTVTGIVLKLFSRFKPIVGGSFLVDYPYATPLPAVRSALVSAAITPAPFSANDPLGVDLSLWPDVDAASAMVSGTTALGQALLRRLTTPRGGLFYDPGYGTDIRSFLNDSMSTDGTSAVEQAIEREVLQDERVIDASAAVTFDFASGTLIASLSVQASDASTFSLVLAVTAITVTLLKAG